MSEHSDRADTVRDVKTTTVRLPDDVAQALDDEAERQGVSTSELVREGVLLRLALAAALRAGTERDVVRAIAAHLASERS
jgi:Arc/MetJ-type ribon-helix-helix transcriptional regulator